MASTTVLIWPMRDRVMIGIEGSMDLKFERTSMPSLSGGTISSSIIKGEKPEARRSMASSPDPRHSTAWTGRLSIEFLQWPAGGPHAKPRLRGTGQLSIEFLGNFEIPYSPEMISKYLANIRIPPEACSQSKFSFGAW